MSTRMTFYTDDFSRVWRSVMVAASDHDKSGYLPGLEARVATFNAPELGEAIKAEVPDFEFPDWRRLWPINETPIDTGRIGVGSVGLARFGKLSEMWGAASLTFTMFGPERPVLVDMRGGEYDARLSSVEVRGLGMPVKLVEDEKGRGMAVPVDDVVRREEVDA